MPRFLEHYRSPPGRAPRVERILASGRAFLAVSALVAIYFDPTEPARFAALMYGLLSGYALYSVVVLICVRRLGRVTTRLGYVLHGIDIMWASALTFFSEGSVSPFFLFFLFVSLAAAYRGGFRETLTTTALTVLILLCETAIAGAGPWRHTWFADVQFDLNPIIIRTTYLLLTGFLLGYLADQEKQFRAEMAALAEAMQQPRVDRGLGGSVSAVARSVLRMFGAVSVDVVIQDDETARAILWQARAVHGEWPEDAVKQLQLDDDHRAAWLFDAPTGPWWSAAPILGQILPSVTVHPAQWTVRPVEVTLPPLFTDGREFRRLAAVDFGLAGQWRGRVLVFDPADAGAAEARLHFLESLGDHIMPVLSNVFLLRRLRSRAGAAERARVARELHDGAIQSLIGIEMKAAALRRSMERNHPAGTHELEHIQELLRDEVIALRELMHELRPVDLDAPNQLSDVLASLVERFGRDTGLSARFVSSAETARLSQRVALEVVRIVQEALVNVRKHSRARHVLVRLSDREGGWALTIQDDGCGFSFAGRLTQSELDSRWVGPAMIRERVRAIRGVLTVDSTPGVGACIEVLVDDAAAS